MDQSTLDFYSSNATTVAARYEAVVSSLSNHFSMAFHTKSKLLDIGFGSGRDLAVLVKNGHDCYGVDPTSELIAVAGEMHPELKGKLLQAALPDLKPPFGGNFDGVLCSAVLMHLPVDQLVVAAVAIARCLRVGGRLLYSVPSKRLDVVEGDRDANGRLFIPDLNDRIQGLFQQQGFRLISSWTNADSMGRDAVEWKSVLMERGA
ncbi:class I SAM-dependent methyltransferase [bacterium]|jgi:SAM-dependent methyltransferase|nr:class I SAM-dependent methyltransferase [bacterium]